MSLLSFSDLLRSLCSVITFVTTKIVMILYWQEDRSMMTANEKHVQCNVHGLIEVNLTPEVLIYLII